MAIGISNPYYPDQPAPRYPLEVENSYYRIQLFDTQLFFPAGVFAQAKFVLLSSEAESSFQSGTMRSLHRLTALKKNIPFRLGINTNLTDWLPARSTDSLRITLKYTVVQNNIFKALLDKLEKLDLAAPLSFVQPNWAAGIRVSQVAGNLLNFFLKEGGQTDVFQLRMEMNLHVLQAGYYAVIGSPSHEILPSKLKIDMYGHLTDRSGHELSQSSYAVFQVLALPRRGPEALREEFWGNLLQLNKEQALAAASGSDEKRSEALNIWYVNLAQLNLLAQKDRSFLEYEIKEIFANAQLEVEQKLQPGTIHQASGLDSYPHDWQQVLGVKTPEELRRMVRDYQDALALTKILLEQYNLPTN